MKKRLISVILILSVALFCACSSENASNDNSVDMEKTIETALSKCDDQTGKNVLKKKVVERFLTYVSFETASDAETEDFPTNENERVLGNYLSAELESIGLENVECDEYSYVYATLPASEGCENAPILALICHMDVSNAAPASDIHTVIKNENGVNMIRTDGKTLLGADDKSGIAETITAVEEMLNHPEYQHPEIRVVITPEEEVGRGTEHIDLEKINADYAYTIDGNDVGELGYETWNAASAKVKFTGYATHAGNAYGKMKNAVTMATDYVAGLPKDALPETTKDRTGFYYVDKISGSVEKAIVSIYIRDFEKSGIQDKKDYLLSLEDKINAQYGEDSCKVTLKDEYPNMKEYIVPENEEMLQYVRDTYTDCGVELQEIAIRGGTDGATLSEMGLPTPNIGTGTQDAHSVNEHIAVESLEKMVEVIINLVSRFAK